MTTTVGRARHRAEAAYADHVAALVTPVAASADAVEAPSADADLEAAYAALANIRPDHEALIRALYLRGLPREALAQELGLEVGTVNVRAFRARRALRDEMARQATEDPATLVPM
ncbi:sigma factor-like helix-turn-helix DNA-binding protein [Natronohydrobacter thiooxidans]|uniref:sigma factor-like helix-turn-helix DNA-binding protein n=1 Tax=Natronohydrobacter thiooxidans TaxID=87172 RepID=UPI000A53C199|nr:sigma factor-like helix-turn-helix DNA-binding protein [Natronohydrobacter thiooxidans]